MLPSRKKFKDGVHELIQEPQLLSSLFHVQFGSLTVRSHSYTFPALWNSFPLAVTYSFIPFQNTTNAFFHPHLTHLPSLPLPVAQDFTHSVQQMLCTQSVFPNSGAFTPRDEYISWENNSKTHTTQQPQAQTNRRSQASEQSELQGLICTIEESRLHQYTLNIPFSGFNCFFH